MQNTEVNEALINRLRENARAEYEGNMFNVRRCECMRAIQRLSDLILNDLSEAEDLDTCARSLMDLAKSMDEKPKL